MNMPSSPSRSPSSGAISRKGSVADLYKRRSYVSSLARAKYFEYTTLLVISINAIWIGVDTDLNTAASLMTAEMRWVIGENFFCFYFTFEVIVRFVAYDRKVSCFTDAWFVFDSILVACMIFETWIVPVAISGGGGVGQLSVLRLLRLLRLTRMARLMRSFPELMTLVKGMVKAMRSVMSTLVLLIVLMYVFGIIMTQWCRAGPDGGYRLQYEAQFCTLPRSMFTLFQVMIVDDTIAVMRDVMDEEMGGTYAYIYVLLLYVLLTSFTILNMLIGVMCDIVSKTAEEEKEKAMMGHAQEKLAEVFAELDADQSGKISYTEFMEMQKSQGCLDAFKILGVDRKDVIALSDSLFAPDDDDGDPSPGGARRGTSSMSMGSRSTTMGGAAGLRSSTMGSRRSTRGRASTLQSKPSRELSFEEFLNTVVLMRPDKTATVLHVADIRMKMNKAGNKIDSKLNSVEELLTDLKGRMERLLRPDGGSAAATVSSRQSFRASVTGGRTSIRGETFDGPGGFQRGESGALPRSTSFASNRSAGQGGGQGQAAQGWAATLSQGLSTIFGGKKAEEAPQLEEQSANVLVKKSRVENMEQSQDHVRLMKKAVLLVKENADSLAREKDETQAELTRVQAEIETLTKKLGEKPQRGVG